MKPRGDVSREDPPDGYEVITRDGRNVGVVAGVSRGSIIVRRRGLLLPSFRALPKTLAVVRASDRTVVMLVGDDEFAQSPKIKTDEPVDDNAVQQHYKRAAIANAPSGIR